MRTQTEHQSLGSFLKLDDQGKPCLEGFQCGACNEVLLQNRRGCPRCGALGSLRARRLAEHGRLFSYTIVHRSFPGIATPFISAIVELDGGVFLKGNLVGVEATPAAVPFDMPVRVQFHYPEVPGHTGKTLLSYVFVPAQPAECPEPKRG